MTYKSYHGFKLHQLDHVPNGKAIECHDCGAKFKRKVQIQKHMRTHTGEKPYKCTMCSSAFKHKDVLDGHIKGVHLAERPFSCVTCSGKFKSTSDLKVHTRTHTGEKPYKCTMCSSAFKDRSSLNCHMRTHSAERPFSCLLCNNKFKSRASSVLINYHRLTHFFTGTALRYHTCAFATCENEPVIMHSCCSSVSLNMMPENCCRFCRNSIFLSGTLFNVLSLMTAATMSKLCQTKLKR